VTLYCNVENTVCVYATNIYTYLLVLVDRADEADVLNAPIFIVQPILERNDCFSFNDVAW